MVYCNTAAILTKALSKHPDDSAAFRVLALGWLNEVVRDVLNQPREWAFLAEPHTIAIVNNTITLPNGAGEVAYVKVGDFYLSLLTEVEADDVDTNGIMYGYTISHDNIITLYGTTTATTAEVKYNPDITADLTDVVTDTVFPIQFENLLVIGTRTHIYDYDKDGRYGKEEAKYSIAMGQVKTLDNRRKAADRTDARGYTRVTFNGRNR